MKLSGVFDARYRIATPVLGALMCLGLAACVSSPESDENSESKARRAAEVNTQLGREYMTRGQYEIALEKLKKAVSSDENYAPAHTMIAVLYEQLGEDDLAGNHFAAAVKASPDNGDVNNNYGSFLCRSGKGRGSMVYFDRALEDPFYRTPAVAMANAGSCALGEGELDTAERYLRKSLQYDPDFPDALLSLAGLSYEQSQYLKARAFIQRYEISGNQTAESLMMGYRVETRLNNPRAASAYRDQLIQRFPGAPETAELQGVGAG